MLVHGADAALQLLIGRAQEGGLEQVCDAHGVALLSAFGSATRTDGAAEDLDIGVSFVEGADVVGLLDDLVVLTEYDGIDLVVLDGAGPVLRSEALTGVPLYEREPGQFARAQMAALAERWDTAWLRRLTLEAMAD